MTRDVWLAKHPYLRPVAEFHAAVHAAAAGIAIPAAGIPIWDEYSDDFHAGVPLLESARVSIDLVEPQNAVLLLIPKLASTPAMGTLAERCRALEADIVPGSGAIESTMTGASGEAALSARDAGLLRYLGCTILVRYLRPVVDAFSKWRNEERWLRNYCPTCGAPPAMAQLVGVDPGRVRFLSCGCCATRWRYQRTACPFCDRQNEHKLAVLAVEGEEGLRIDYCETCDGYLKTYTGNGDDSFLLADWTSLHLDLLARDRGLKRLAASLYEI